MTSTWVIILIIIVACCVIGFPFTYIYWRQADKWEAAEARRAKASRDAAQRETQDSTDDEHAPR